MTTTFTLDDLLTPDQKARLKQGQSRLSAAGMVFMLLYDDRLKPIVEQERLRDIWNAMTVRLLEHYPVLLLEDPDALHGALHTATYIGLLLGSQYSFPAELIAWLQPQQEQEAHP